MNNDIVTRLRKKLVMEALGDKATYLTLGDCLEAADEIERLRENRDNWQAIAFCRTCEPADGYYCTKHRSDEEGKQ